MRQDGVGQHSFAHASEAELARILDFYDVRWDYEPDTFPIAWNLDGDVVESFSPDFYLPELELYVELTTLKQKLVRKKNRKLRRLRELYPDIRIKLFYARDFRMLLLKFGRLALVDELTGTSGQSTPPRTQDVLVPVMAPERQLTPVPAASQVASGDAPLAAPTADAGDGALDEDDAATTRLTTVGRPEGRGRRRGRRRHRSAASVALAALTADDQAVAIGLDPGPQPA